MANDFVNNIRRIAGTDELKKLLDELRATGDVDNLNGIDGRRGIGYKNESFNGSGIQQGSSATSFKNGSAQAPVAIPHPVNSSDGSVSASDLLNDTSGLVPDSGADSGLYTGDQLRELTGLEDCTTGDEVEVRFDGQYKSPSTWDEANTPPGGGADTTWTSGVYYGNAITIGASTIFGSSGNEVLDAVLQNLIDGNPSFTFVETSREPFSSTTISGNLVFNYRIRYDQLNPDGTTAGFGNGASYAFGCTGGETGDAGVACGVMSAPTRPTETQWPEDTSRPLYLSWGSSTGVFAPSQYDPGVPTKYTNGLSQLNLCVTGSGEYVTITPTKDGGFAIYETTTQGGALASGATIKKFSRDLTLEGAIDADQLNLYLPE